MANFIQSLDEKLKKTFTPTTVSGINQSIVPEQQGPLVNMSVAPVIPNQSVIPKTGTVLPQPKPTVTSTVPKVNTPVVSPYTAPITTPPPITNPGSTASLMYEAGINPDQATIDLINARNKTAALENIDPNQVYQNTLQQYQGQIDAINNIYNDQLNQSRITNAPTYKGRIESRQFSQGRSGQIGSGTGEALLTDVTRANAQDQANAEAIINDKKAQAIANIYGQIRTSSEAALKAKYEAQKAGSDATLAEINARPAEKAKRVSAAVRGLVAQGVDINDLTPEELKSFTSGLGVSSGDLQSAYASEKTISDTAKAKLESEQASTAKTTAETAQIGKITPYQSAQIAIDWYKAKNPTIPASDKKLNAIGGVATLFSPSQTLPDGTRTNIVPGTKGVPFIDESGFITPEGWKTVAREAASDNITKKDLLQQFGGMIAPGLESKYGLTPADIKILQGVLPVANE